MIHFTDLGGRKLTQVHVQLIFWGDTWKTNPGPTPPSAKAIDQAVLHILESDYLLPLFQYGVSRGTKAPPVIVSSTTPPNPFQWGDVDTFLRGLLAANLVPGPDQNVDTLYVVIMPDGTANSDPFVWGQHGSSIYPLIPKPPMDNLFYAWVTGYPTLDDVTRVFSHELAEACTDPIGATGVVGDPGSCTSVFGVCEIADPCEATSGMINGVTVQAYWSQLDGKCILPQTAIPPLWSSILHWVETHAYDPDWLISLWQAIHGGDPSPELHDLVTLSVLVALANTLGPGDLPAQLRDLLLPALQRQIRRAQEVRQSPALQQPLSEAMVTDFQQQIDHLASELLTSELRVSKESIASPP
jgi:hypothetical protein